MKTGIIAFAAVFSVIGGGFAVKEYNEYSTYHGECGPPALAGYHERLIRATADHAEYSVKLSNWHKNDDYGRYKQSAKPIVESLLRSSEVAKKSSRNAIIKCGGIA